MVFIRLWQFLFMFFLLSASASSLEYGASQQSAELALINQANMQEFTKKQELGSSEFGAGQKFQDYIDSLPIDEDPLIEDTGGTLDFPEGFFDGPSDTDIAFSALKMLLGEPIIKIRELIFSADSTSYDISDVPENTTLIMRLVHVFNSIGLFGILFISASTSIVFFFQRSVELGYLQPGKPNESVFTLVRGSYSFILSVPLAPFGGLSIAQILGAAVILFGLGLATVVIKIGTSSMMLPAAVVYNYPSIDKFTKSLLDANLCMHANINAGRFKDDRYNPDVPATMRTISYPVTLASHNAKTDIASVKFESRITFGGDARCGSLELGSSLISFKLNGVEPENLVASLRGDNDQANASSDGEFITTSNASGFSYYISGVDYANGTVGSSTSHSGGAIIDATDMTSGQLIKKFTSIALTKAALHSAIITFDGLNDIGKRMQEKEYGENNDTVRQDIKTFAAIEKAARNVVISTMTDQLKSLYGINSLRENGETQAINDMIDAIGDLGFMGLGSIYNQLNKQSEAFNEAIQDTFNDIEYLDWSSSIFNLGYEDDGFVAWFWGLFGDDFKEVRARINKNKNMFFNTYDLSQKNSGTALRSITADLSAENGFESLLGDIARYMATRLIMGGQMIAGTREISDSDAYFPDPITEIRAIGNTIINTTLAIAAYSALTDDDDDEESSAGDNQEGLMSGLFSTIMTGLFGIGVLYSVIIPSLPYVMWSLASLSMIAFYIESFFGMGWWGLGITQGGGESLAGRSSEGVNTLMSLLFLPALMCASFFVALLLNRVLGFYVDITLDPAMEAISEGSMTALSFFGLLLMNGILLLAGIYKNLSLIWELPPIMLSWASIKSPHADQGHQEAKSATLQAGTTFTGGLGSAIGKL